MSELEQVPWHYLRTNASVRYPRRIVCLDSEASIRERKTGSTHTLRLAAASFDQLDPEGGPPIKTERTVTFEAGELWEWITARTKSKSRTVVFAHNLGYDLRLTDGIGQLERLGWERMFLAIDGIRTCARYRLGSKSLALVDSTSFYPCSLADLAGRLGLVKRPLPDPDADEQEWAAYCLSDVDALRAAVLYLLDWLERNDCGMFRLTGPAQAMAVFRHRFLRPGTMLVHKDEDALAAERTAAWAGRCEAYRHGSIDGPLFEWDFTLAYLTLAQRLWLPTQLWGERDDLSIRQLLQVAQRKRVLAEVDVATAAPLLPAQTDKGVAWPVGEFTTTAWDIELRAAHERGAEITVRRCWLYRPKPALQDWATWLLDLLDPAGLPAAAPERIMLKAWARSLVGRFGMRVPVWTELGDLPEPGLRYLPSIDADSGESGAILELGDRSYERAGLVDAADAMPGVLSYIMAASRVRLLEAIEWAGWGNVVYTDTDSLLVDREGHARLVEHGADCTQVGLRLKAEYRHATVFGPRQLILDGELRVAGLPKKAVRQSERAYDAELWESLAGTLGRGKAAEVRVQRRTIRLRGTDNRRRHLADGQTEPLRLSAGAV